MAATPRGSVADLVAGATFGSALFASGVYVPSVIFEQLELTNFHMLSVFMGASATSAIVIYAADHLGYAPIDVRQPRSGGLFPYDKNVLGGALTGAGMALAGACPGTVLVQVATGVKAAPYIGAGAILGGLAHSIATNRSSSATVAPASKSKSVKAEPAATLQAKTGLDTETLLFVYEAALVAAIAATLTLAPNGGFGWQAGLIGGALIGAAQAATVFLTRHSIGVSRAYGDLADYVLSLWNGGAGSSSAPSKSLVTPSVVFGVGILAGSRLLLQSTADATATSRQAPLNSSTAVAAVLGGFVSVVGSRIAGGCTSGHGISGMATFSVASFVTVAAMFGTGVALKAVLP